jgi:hypothetical protein
MVDVYFKGGGSPRTHMMHQSQVDTFLKATIRLHHTHGNPHLEPAKQMLANLWEVRVHGVEVPTVSYWWCAESLQAKDAKGAKLNPPSIRSTRLWAHPDLLASETEDRRRDDEDEARM